MKFIDERTMFKTLIESNGLLFSITFEDRAFFFLLSRRFIGVKTAPTTDPFPGIVELCDYDLDLIIKEWPRLGNVKETERRPSRPPPVGHQLESS